MANIFKYVGSFRFLNKTELAKLTPEELGQYEYRLKNYRDLKNVIQTAFDEGKAKGRLEGLLEVKLEAKLEMARTLKENGATKANILQITGLTEKQIEDL